MMRRRQLFHLPMLLLPLASCAQEDSTAPPPHLERFVYRIGATDIAIRKTVFDSTSRWFLLLLHDDENTAETAATAFLQQWGGTLLQLENNNERLVRFSLSNRLFSFDPNRIFSAAGIRRNMALFRSPTAQAARAVLRFRDSLLHQLPPNGLIVAVHNNTPGRYTIRSYTKEKNLRADAANVYINPEKDGDDFFITTDHGLFKKLAAAGQNCVLQKARPAYDDGSLSYYLGNKRRSYVNVEAEAGHLEEQKQMLQLLKHAMESTDR